MRFREVYLWIGLPLVVLCLWVLFFLVPSASNMEAKKRELADIEARIARVDAELAQSKEHKADGHENTIRNSYPDQIPRLEAFPDFMKKIASSVRNSGITLGRLKGRLPEGTTGTTGSALGRAVAEMDFTGRFLDIGRMLEQIEALKAYRRIVRAQLVTVEDSHPELRGSVDIEFKAWRE